MDTHAHLEASAFEWDVDLVVERARQAGVGRILAVGSDLASSRRSIELANQCSEVYAAVGTHPHEARRFQQEVSDLRKLLASPKVVAIGEVGLDYGRNPEDRVVQLEVFEEQLQWAEEAKLPVSVHNRLADADVLERLRQFAGAAILHCFSGSPDFLAKALAHGCFVSFAGNVTFRKAEELRKLARLVPQDRLLLETDSPVLAPQRWRGRRNEPAHIPATYEVVAEARGLEVKELASGVKANADRVLGWHG